MKTIELTNTAANVARLNAEQACEGPLNHTSRKIYTIDVIDDLGREWEPMASSHDTAEEGNARMDAILPGLRRDFARDTGRAQTLIVTLYECDREENDTAGSGHSLRSEEIVK